MSEEPQQVTVYDVVGGMPFFEELVERFYARVAVDEVLLRFLGDRRAELAGMDREAAALADEIVRIVRAGGKRIRPTLCVWAFGAAGGDVEDELILRAAAALELLHTSALVHDDVMDRDVERRGEPATHVRFAKEAPAGADPDGFGTAAAVLVGDLALVLSERLMRTSGFDAERLELAMTRFDRMRTRTRTLSPSARNAYNARRSTLFPRSQSLKVGSWMVLAAVAGMVLFGGSTTSRAMRYRRSPQAWWQRNRECRRRRTRATCTARRPRPS